MREFGEQNNDQLYDKISDFELGLMRERADRVLPKPSGNAPSRHLWDNGESIPFRNMFLERSVEENGGEVLTGVKFQSEPEAALLITEYKLHLDTGLFFVLRERHEGVVMIEPLLANMDPDMANMLLQLGQLKPDPNDLEDFSQLVDEAAADKSKKLHETIGQSATKRSVPIKFL